MSELIGNNEVLVDFDAPIKYPSRSREGIFVFTTDFRVALSPNIPSNQRVPGSFPGILAAGE
jgi:hypothetical protein